MLYYALMENNEPVQLVATFSKPQNKNMILITEKEYQSYTGIHADEKVIQKIESIINQI